MSTSPPTGLRLSLLLLAVLVAVNGAAVWSLVSLRRAIDSSARDDFLLQTTVHARALEAALAGLRGDLIFLSQSPAMAKARTVLAGDDPLSRRQGRLDIETSLLLFLVAHPEVTRLAAVDEDASPWVVAGRQKGAPALLPPGKLGTEADSGALRGSWSLGAGGQGMLQVSVSIPGLLTLAAPGLERELSIESGVRQDEPAPDPADATKVVARVQVEERGWVPPVAWTLVHSASRGALLSSVQALAASYRGTVVLNLFIMGLTLVLGTLAFRQVRRTTLLEAESRQQDRMRELERRAMHSERLASLGRMAAGIAHEINNPLEGMGNYLSLAEEDLADAGPAETRSHLKGVRDGLERVAGIVRQVLKFSDPGHAPRVLLDLEEVLAETVGFVAANPGFRGIAVSFVRSDEPLNVLGNRTTLGQLFLNLLINACECQGEQGVVEVASRRDGERAVVTVSDRGPGIAAEVLPRIFEPFFSTRGSSGLGLSVCYSIAVDHGGTILAANRPDGGAVFTVALAMARNEA